MKVITAIARVFDCACSQFCIQIDTAKLHNDGIKTFKYLDAESASS